MAGILISDTALSEWRPLDQDPASLPDPDFTAQYSDSTRILANFWGTLVVEVRPGMSDEELVLLMARLEEAAGDDLA